MCLIICPDIAFFQKWLRIRLLKVSNVKKCLYLIGWGNMVYLAKCSTYCQQIVATTTPPTSPPMCHCLVIILDCSRYFSNGFVLWGIIESLFDECLMASVYFFWKSALKHKTRLQQERRKSARKWRNMRPYLKENEKGGGRSG